MDYGAGYDDDMEECHEIQDMSSPTPEKHPYADDHDMSVSEYDARLQLVAQAKRQRLSTADQDVDEAPPEITVEDGPPESPTDVVAALLAAQVDDAGLSCLTLGGVSSSPVSSSPGRKVARILDDILESNREHGQPNPHAQSNLAFNDDSDPPSCPEIENEWAGMPTGMPTPGPMPSVDDQFAEDVSMSSLRAAAPPVSTSTPTARKPPNQGAAFPDLYLVQLQNTRGPSTTAICVGCDNRAKIHCRTCFADLCSSCDAERHMGQTCRPLPCVRKVLRSGVRLAPKEFLDESDTIEERTGVYVRCEARCDVCCGCSWTPVPETATDTLTVLSLRGRDEVDRVAFKCLNCDTVIPKTEARLYTTASTLPMTLGNACKQIMCTDYAHFVSILSVVGPGLSSSVVADTLTHITNENYPRRASPKSVRGQTILDMLKITAALRAASQRDIATPSPYDMDMTWNQPMGSDAMFKIAANKHRTGAEKNTPTDNNERREILDDETVRRLEYLDKRPPTKQKVDSDDGDGGPNMTALRPTRFTFSRSGLLSAVGASGAPIMSLYLPLGRGERFIFHYQVLWIAKLMGAVKGKTFSWVTLDVGCQFVKYLPVMDRRLGATLAWLIKAIDAAPEDQPLHAQLDINIDESSLGALPTWYRTILEQCSEQLNSDSKITPNTWPSQAKSQHITVPEMHAVLKGVVTVLEVYGQHDTRQPLPDNIARMTLGPLPVKLNAMHARTHSKEVQLFMDCWMIVNAGRWSDGEMVERYHAMLLACIAIVASSTTENLKLLIAELNRHICQRKMSSMPATMNALITRSALALAPAAASLLIKAREYCDHFSADVSAADSTSQTAWTSAVEALASSTRTQTTAQHVIDWAKSKETQDVLEIITSHDVIDLEKHERDRPSKRLLHSVVSQLIINKTKAQLCAALSAIQEAAGPDKLAGETARDAIRLSVKIPTPTTQTEFSCLTESLRKCGIPALLLVGVASEDTEASWAEADVADLIHYSAMSIAVDELVVLLSNIRRWKDSLYGAGANTRAVGSHGGDARCGERKIAKQLLAKQKSLYQTWVKTYNDLSDKLRTSISTWQDSHTTIPPPVLQAEFPHSIKSADAVDISWDPPDLGLTKKARVVAALINSHRCFCRHFEEAHTTGPCRAVAFVDLLHAHCRHLEARLQSSLDLLQRPGGWTDAVEVSLLASALGDGTADRLLRRHYGDAMRVPQTLVSTEVDTSHINRNAVLPGYCAALQYANVAAHADLARAQSTLKAYLPATDLHGSGSYDVGLSFGGPAPSAGTVEHIAAAPTPPICNGTDVAAAAASTSTADTESMGVVPFNAATMDHTAASDDDIDEDDDEAFNPNGGDLEELEELEEEGDDSVLSAVAILQGVQLT
eukprot:m.62963 g.62963  ORF g.62963 m.62963 type:complete len:1381 (-) comp17738_c0_seq2:54-4196(-)